MTGMRDRLVVTFPSIKIVVPQRQHKPALRSTHRGQSIQKVPWGGCQTIVPWHDGLTVVKGLHREVRYSAETTGDGIVLGEADVANRNV
jgi:hypothetical protein